MLYMTKINKITSAANQNQPVHRIIETSSFMPLLRAQLVAKKHWFPYITLVNVNAPVVATTSWWLHFTAPVVALKVKKIYTC